MQPPVRLPGLLDAMRGVQRAGHLGCVPAYAIQAAELGLSATVVESCRAHQRTAELSWHLRTDLPPMYVLTEFNVARPQIWRSSEPSD